MTEEEKYEILEKIGMLLVFDDDCLRPDSNIGVIKSGHGSFGIIRKVRRKSDGHVRLSITSNLVVFISILTISQDSMS